MRQRAIQTGRQDAVIAIDFASEFGLRLEEICTLRIEYLTCDKKTVKKEWIEDIVFSTPMR